MNELSKQIMCSTLWFPTFWNSFCICLFAWLHIFWCDRWVHFLFAKHLFFWHFGHFHRRQNTTTELLIHKFVPFSLCVLKQIFYSWHPSHFWCLAWLWQNLVRAVFWTNAFDWQICLTLSVLCASFFLVIAIDKLYFGKNFESRIELQLMLSNWTDEKGVSEPEPCESMVVVRVIDLQRSVIGALHISHIHIISCE